MALQPGNYIILSSSTLSAAFHGVSINVNPSNKPIWDVYNQVAPDITTIWTVEPTIDDRYTITSNFGCSLVVDGGQVACSTTASKKWIIEPANDGSGGYLIILSRTDDLSDSAGWVVPAAAGQQPVRVQILESPDGALGYSKRELFLFASVPS
ncbi:hypothetical protein BX600DRAFT_514460 [Xylariales sp. PMI_506]|nr:hypothetical protein BX600DRAFT_514460 [Xylariales sp. PMI_506]